MSVGFCGGRGATRGMRARVGVFVFCCVGVVAKTGSRPCVFRPPSMAAGYFLLLVQREVTKRKTPSRPRSRAHPCAPDCASRLRGSPTVRPCTEVELAGLLPAIAVATDPAPARRGREGPGKSETRQSLPQKRCEVSPHIATPFIDDAAYMRRTPSPSFRRKPESILPLLLLSGPL